MAPSKQIWLPGMQRIAGYDLDANRILPPPQIRALPWAEQVKWAKNLGMRPTADAEAAHTGFLARARELLAATKLKYPGAEFMRASLYSMFEMMQNPGGGFGMAADGPTVTAAGEAVISQTAIMTLPATPFPIEGKAYWLHFMGILSSPVTTPGTFTFRLRKGTGALGDTLIIASGACAPDVAVHTSAMFWIDIWIKAIAIGPTATSLTLEAHGKVNLSSSDVTLAAQQALYMPAGNVAQANVASHDGITAANQTLTLTCQPSLATGSVTLREAWIIAMN